MITYYCHGDGYIALNGETTMQGTIHVGRGPNGAGAIVEQCWHDNQLARMTPVEAYDVPDDWVRRLGYEEPQPPIEPPEPPSITEWQLEVRIGPEDTPHEYLPGYWRDVALLVVLYIGACVVFHAR